jgi:glycerol-3-phosphate O-acyltransferase
MVPHIASGINLSLWPLGHIFRHCGAFFLKRSFRGDNFYAFVFNQYLRKLIKEGFTIEFFIEGGRSRSGKLLPPKFGILRALTEAILHGAGEDLYFVPISVGYEKIIEETGIIKELHGAEKEKEKIGNLWKTTKLFQSKHGRIYVQFGEPLSLNSLWKEQGYEYKPEEEKEFRYHLKKLGHRLLHEVNKVTTVSPSALLAMALLSHHRRGISRIRLMSKVGYLLHFISEKGGRLSKTLNIALQAKRSSLTKQYLPENTNGTNAEHYFGKNFSAFAPKGQAIEDVIDEAIHLFSQYKLVQIFDEDGESIYQILPDMRLNLDYYKNNIVHFFVQESILSTAFLRLYNQSQLVEKEALRERALFLSGLFKYEFIYPLSDDPQMLFDRTLAYFLKVGLLKEMDSKSNKRCIERQSEAMPYLLFYKNIIKNYLESYWLGSKALKYLLKGPMEDKDLEKYLLKLSERDYVEGDISLRESCSKANLKNALALFEDMGIIKKSIQLEKKRRVTTITLDLEYLENPSRLDELIEEIASYI